MTPAAIYATPIRVFWMLWANVDRLRAELELRSLLVAAAATNPGTTKSHAEGLSLAVGKTVVTERIAAVEQVVDLDREGLDELRRM